MEAAGAPKTVDPRALGRTPDERDERYRRASTLAARAPIPARIGRVLAGTAGWTDPSLIRSHRFYPPGATSAEDRLRFYATRFSLAEVDSTYYALPSRANAQRWAERTPAGFTFDVKAFAPLTGHPVEPARLPADLRGALSRDVRDKPRLYPRDLPGAVLDALWDRFTRALEPLLHAGRLGCILLQFPPWFTATQANAKVLERCRARLDGLRVAVELRSASWGEPERLPRLAALLSGLGASYVIVDEPQGTPTSMPPAVLVPDRRLAVVRFHGRRTETWRAAASVEERFDHLYDPRELAPWTLTVARLAGQVQEVHLVFNNCVSNHAVLGAQGLIALLVHEQAADRRRSPPLQRA
jgi:uncharacterized protein YecE (DUF72 family)